MQKLPNGHNARRLSKGNSKIDKSVLIFDLPPIKSCLNCSDCKKTCYAIKAYRQYPQTKRYRDYNFYLAKKYPEKLFKLIADQLKHSECSTVRIHSSGDFFRYSRIYS